MGQDGSLQEWTEDYGQLEDKHRHFSHLYGLFPGAEGIAQATAEQKTQIDHDGTPLPHLPAVARVAQISRQAIYRTPKPRRVPASPGRLPVDEVEALLVATNFQTDPRVDRPAR